MKANIIPIGNSRGIRIPKPLLDQCGLLDQVDIDVQDRTLVISPVQPHRSDWAHRFEATASQHYDDPMVLDDTQTSDWDETEWQWPTL